jgi:hypothetical protein
MYHGSHSMILKVINIPSVLRCTMIKKNDTDIYWSDNDVVYSKDMTYFINFCLSNLESILLLCICAVMGSWNLVSVKFHFIYA